MSQATHIILRVFTGPHAGAEIALASGSYVLGSGESCDIIFNDSSVAPHHARLQVEDGEPAADSEPEQTGACVRLFPMEGEVTVLGEPLAEGAALAPATTCFLGMTCVAWAEPDKADDAWTKIKQALAPLLFPELDLGVKPEEPKEDAPQAPDDDGKPDKGGLLPTEFLNANDVATPPSRFTAVRRAVLRRVPLVLVILLLAILSISLGRKMNQHTPSPEDLRQKLTEAGFGTLEVVLEKGGLSVRGKLDTDIERGRLVRLVQSMHDPVWLDVSVESDLADALVAAFNSRGLFPRVKKETTENGKSFHVSGYMKDGIVEAWAFAGAREDLPPLASEKNLLMPEIIHAAEVDMALSQELNRAGLHNLAVVYLPGTVEISGSLDTQQREALNQALSETRRKLGIPLTVAVVEKAPDLGRETAAQIPAPELGQKSVTPSTAPAAASPGIASFRVVGVTMQPLRFISLESGEKVFEGGRLPGGYTLESIATSQLVLSRNGQNIIYPLRDSND